MYFVLKIKNKFQDNSRMLFIYTSFLKSLNEIVQCADS